MKVLVLACGLWIVSAPAGLAGQTRFMSQKDMIADLTGWSDGGWQARPFSRSTPEEREAAAAYLFGRLSEAGLDPQRHEYRFRNVNGWVDLLLPPYEGTNIYAVAPATTTSSEVVVVGAHYDSEFGSPGAIDNASGVALVMAMAHRVASLPSRARHFLFVFFDQEEDDEVGSRAFVEFLGEARYEVHSVHVVDLAGSDEDQDGGVEIQSPTPELESLYRSVAAGLSIPLDVTEGGSSDNKSFLAAGLPTVGVFQDDLSPHIHRSSDTLEAIDFEFLESMTALVAAAMRVLADA